MNSKKEEYIKINFSKKRGSVEAFLRVVNFRDGDFEIAYMPSLNLSGYGDTPQEADAMLSETAKDYLISLRSFPESRVMQDLREYGWERRPFLSKELLNTQFLSTDKIRENFDLPAETQFNERFVTA